MNFEPNTEYRVTGIEVDQIEDVWDEGQIGEFTSQEVTWIKIAPTEYLTDMVAAIEDNFDEVINVDTWDSTITVTLMIDEYDGIATKAQMDEWMKGNLRLWNQDYTFHVEKVTVDSEPYLQDILNEEAKI